MEIIETPAVWEVMPKIICQIEPNLDPLCTCRSLRLETRPSRRERPSSTTKIRRPRAAKTRWQDSSKARWPGFFLWFLSVICFWQYSLSSLTKAGPRWPSVNPTWSSLLGRFDFKASPALPPWPHPFYMWVALWTINPLVSWITCPLFCSPTAIYVGGHYVAVPGTAPQSDPTSRGQDDRVDP